VNVSTEEEENFLTDLKVDLAEAEDDDDDDRDDDEPRGDYRTLVTEVEFDLDPGDRLN